MKHPYEYVTIFTDLLAERESNPEATIDINRVLDAMKVPGMRVAGWRDGLFPGLDTWQQTVVATASKETNLIVDAPAGTGKTMTALAVAAEVVTAQNPGKVLIVTSSKYASEAVTELCIKNSMTPPVGPDQEPAVRFDSEHETLTEHEMPFWRRRLAAAVTAQELTENPPSTDEWSPAAVALTETSDAEYVTSLAVTNGHLSARKARRRHGHKVPTPNPAAYSDVAYIRLLNELRTTRTDFVSPAAADVHTAKQSIHQSHVTAWNETMTETPRIHMVDQANVNTLIPLDARYDLVIIDEAHAVSVFEAVPILARSRRFVLFGDHTQLPPDTELVDATRHSKFHTSILTAAKGQRLRLLNHYRCLPELMEFVNTRYYDTKLTVTTHRPTLSQAGTFTHLTDLTPKHVVDWIATKAEQGTVGVIVGDNYDTVNEINQLAAETLTPELLAASQLRVDTLRNFVGGERDHILFVIPPDTSIHGGLGTHPGAIVILATRGKNGLDIMSAYPASHYDGTEMRELIRHLQTDLSTPHKTANDPWTRRVGELLQDAGHDIYYNLKTGDHTIDIVVGTLDNSIALNTTPRHDGPQLGWTTFNVSENRYGTDTASMVEFVTEMQERIAKETGNESLAPYNFGRL